VCVFQKSDSASTVPSGFLPNPVCTCKYRQKEWMFLSITSWFFTCWRLYTNPLLESNPSTTARYPSPFICAPLFLPALRCSMHNSNMEALFESFHWARVPWLTGRPPELANCSTSSSLALSKGAPEPNACPRPALLGAGGRRPRRPLPLDPDAGARVPRLRRLGVAVAEFARCLRPPPFPPPRPATAEELPPKRFCRAEGAVGVVHPSPAPARGAR